jgi:hypothetical protein
VSITVDTRTVVVNYCHDLPGAVVSWNAEIVGDQVLVTLIDPPPTGRDAENLATFLALVANRGEEDLLRWALRSWGKPLAA